MERGDGDGGGIRTRGQGRAGAGHGVKTVKCLVLQSQQARIFTARPIRVEAIALKSSTNKEKERIRSLQETKARANLVISGGGRERAKKNRKEDVKSLAFGGVEIV